MERALAFVLLQHFLHCVLRASLSQHHHPIAVTASRTRHPSVQPQADEAAHDARKQCPTCAFTWLDKYGKVQNPYWLCERRMPALTCCLHAAKQNECPKCFSPLEGRAQRQRPKPNYQVWHLPSRGNFLFSMLQPSPRNCAALTSCRVPQSTTHLGGRLLTCLSDSARGALLATTAGRTTAAGMNAQSASRL